MLEELSDDFKGIIDKIGATITQATPASPRGKPLPDGAFELNPYIEKVLIDPFKTFPLDKLTESQLSIDNVISYLESIVPSDVLSVIKNIPGLENELKAQGKSLEQYIVQIKNILPSNIKIGNLLREVNLGAITSNLEQFKSLYETLGKDFDGISSDFLVTGLNAIEEVKQKYGGTISSIGPILTSETPIASLFHVTGIAIAENNEGSKTSKSLASIFKAVGQLNTAPLLEVAKQSSRYELPSVLHAVKLLGSNEMNEMASDVSISHSNAITGVNNTYTKLLKADVFGEMSISDAHVKNLAAISDIGSIGSASLKAGFDDDSISYDSASIAAEFISIIGIADCDTLLTIISGSTVPSIKTTYIDVISDAANLYSLSTLEDIVNSIIDSDLTTWLANNDRVPVDDFITLIETTDVNNVRIFVNILKGISAAYLPDKLTALAAVPTPTYDLIAGYAVRAPTKINFHLQTIKSAVKEDFILAHNLTSAYGEHSVHRYAFLLKNTSLATTINVVNGLKNIPLEKFQSVTSLLESQSTDTISQLIMAFSNNPITNIKKYQAMVSPFKEFAALKSMVSYSLIGDYSIVRDLVTSFPKAVTLSDRKMLVKNLLQNYKYTDDEATLGVITSASIFLQALKIIDPNILLTTRNGETVSNYLPWTWANTKALWVLLHNEECVTGVLIEQKRRNG